MTRIRPNSYIVVAFALSREHRDLLKLNDIIIPFAKVECVKMGEEHTMVAFVSDDVVRLDAPHAEQFNNAYTEWLNAQ